MQTYERGNRSEALVLDAYIKAGFNVSIPFGTGASYDLVVDTGARLLKIQVKTGWIHNGCVSYLSRRKAGSTWKANRRFLDGEVDYFVIYCPANDELYAVLALGHGTAGRLRISPVRNSQHKHIKWASDYLWDDHIKTLMEG